ncbi:tripartite tricarboxylate transporter TctB family protein [Sulfurospirillum sp. 1307]
MNKKYIEIILSIFFIVLSALLFSSADTVSNAVSKASTDSSSLYVQALAIALGIAGVVELAMSIISNPSFIEFTKRPDKFFTLILLLIAYVWIMEYIGFILGTLIFIPATMRAMGYNKFIKSIIISIAITAGVYLLFQVGFEILLPEITIF